ncbi:hypothetical protein BpHYR1_034779 [Brachionus plicatilis]|uniref:Uncharacterized protein n=1 Tax=Brachionus plicatilis TaxID=10195 RepID=A0A3M7S1V6_BRAPC|nr:hypothetical protein BpHYR1_034779 [Brachionus plicatilis]
MEHEFELSKVNKGLLYGIKNITYRQTICEMIKYGNEIVRQTVRKIVDCRKDDEYKKYRKYKIDQGQINKLEKIDGTIFIKYDIHCLNKIGILEYVPIKELSVTSFNITKGVVKGSQ